MTQIEPNGKPIDSITHRRIRARYLMGGDAIATVFSFIISLLLRYELIEGLTTEVVLALPLIVIATLVRIFYKFVYREYDQVWQHMGPNQALRMFTISIIGSATIILINFALFPRLGIPNIKSIGVLVIEWVVNLLYLGSSRLSLRIIINWLATHQKRVLAQVTKHQNVLIMGAGEVGATVLRLIQQNPEMGLNPVGFIDDDPNKQSARLLNVTVLGDRLQIPRLVRENRIDEVIVAMPTAPQHAIDNVCEICASVPVRTRVIPSIYNLIAGTMSLDELRQWRSTEIRRPVEKNEAGVTDYKNMIVTGGAGFIGSNFTRYMLEKYPHYRLVILDKLTYAGNMDNLLGLNEQYGDRFVFVKGDIADFGQVSSLVEQYDIGVIVNFAAETHVDRSLLEPESFLNTNIYGTYVLLEIARQYGLKRYHQVSTDEVYGQVLRGSFNEEDPLDTRSPYSASKAAADLLVNAYHISFGVPTTITRGSNNIGPYQYPEKAVPLFITNALENQPLPVYGDGLYVRDYQYVIDHCQGIDFIMHYGCPGEIYNIGGGNEVAAIDLARIILDKLGKPQSLIRLVRDRDGQDRRYSLNCSKIKSMGWKSQWDFETALDTTIDWYINNEWWWSKLKSGEYREYYKKQYHDRLQQVVREVLFEDD